MKSYVIGNGINRYLNKNSLSWEALIINLWNHFNQDNIQEVPLGISNTEIMELLFLRANSIKNIKKNISGHFEEWENINFDNKVSESVQRFCTGKNIITTNYDHILGNLLNLRFFVNYKEGFTDVYPWKSFLSSDETLQSSKIWFLHGTKYYHRSIRIGLNDYHNAIAKAKRTIPLINTPNQISQISENYENSVLKHFLEDDLEIYGISLAADELFLRWLLFEKARNYQQTTATYNFVEQDEGEGIRFLFEKLNFTLKKYNSYEEMYS